MKKLSGILLLSALAFPSLSYADDADSNNVARYIKYYLMQDIKTYYKGGSGYCDVMIRMNHRHGKALYKGASTTGDGKLCSFIKKRIKNAYPKQGVPYERPEKLIQIQIVH